MTLTEILPSLQKLSHFEKVKAIQFLATELTKDEQMEKPMKFGRHTTLSPQKKF